jgi:hypothetical protein
MTDGTNHHPPHEHPDFDAYLDSLTDDDLAAINAAILQAANEQSDPTRYRQQPGTETTPDNDLNDQ